MCGSRWCLANPASSTGADATFELLADNGPGFDDDSDRIAAALMEAAVPPINGEYVLKEQALKKKGKVLNGAQMWWMMSGLTSSSELATCYMQFC